MPLFSIVVPTRNRAHLLRYALKSAVNQTFDNYEIVVSNNSSTDDTERVVEEFQCSRLRYVRTEKMLSMADHWDFALTHARGEYITYLCDDDALHSTLLEKVAKALCDEQNLVTWGGVWYYHSTWEVPEERNRAKILGNFSGQTQKIDSKTDMKDILQFVYQMRHPKMLNSFCAAKLLAKVRENLGRVFPPPCPDYSVGLATLALIDSYTYLDQPLYVAGQGRESMGASTLYRRGEAAYTFLNEFSDDNLLAGSPLKSMVTTNHVMSSIARVKQKMEPYFKDMTVDMTRYFTQVYMQLKTLERVGVDISADLQEFDMVLSMQSAEVQEQISKRLNELMTTPVDKRKGLIGTLRKTARRTIGSSSFLSNIESKIRYKTTSNATSKPNKVVFLEGNGCGFSNIIECCDYIAESYHRL